MDIEQKYQKAFQGMEKIISKRVKDKKFMAMGYTSNLDMLCDFQVERLNELLKEHMPDSKLPDMKPAGSIRTMTDLLKTLVYYCSNGIGGEVDVENTALIGKSFQFKLGMGGTAVQAALALSELECPSLVHLTDNSKEVCNILNTPFVYTINEDGRLVHTDNLIQTQEQEVHFIVQFKKGDKIYLKDQEIEIPCSNRLILTKVTVNKTVPFSRPYFKWIEKNARQVSSNVLSSFNVILDSAILKERLDYVEQHVRVYRRYNPGAIVYFEDAHYHDDAVRRLCLETVYSSVDIVSLNEEELSYTLDMYGFPVDIEDIISCVKGAKFIRGKFGIRRGVIVHTKDYSMYVGERLEADIETGLIYGNLIATAKARNGWYGTREQIKEVLELECSAKGIESGRKVAESEYASEVILVPSKYIDKPRYTIGLGDSFVGGVQICF